MNYHPSSSQEKASKPFNPKRLNWDTLTYGSSHWVLKNLLPAVGVSLIAGESTAGKTFVTLAIASAVARGEPVLGRRTNKCGVAYIGAEGGPGLEKRVVALRSANPGAWDNHCVLACEAPDLGEDDSFGSMVRWLEQTRSDMHANGARLGLVVIDTLSASIPGVDENSAADMSKVMFRLQELAKALNVSVLLVCHVGKDSSRGVRGWSGLKANADAVIMVERVNGVRVVRIDKVKDGDCGPPIEFTLSVVVLGEDDDGDQVSSCIVAWGEKVSDSKSGRRELCSSDKIMLRQLKRLTDSGQTEPVAALGAPRGTCGVRAKTLKLAFGRVYDPDAADPDNSDKAAADRLRKNYQNCICRLETRGLLRNEGGLVWLVGPNLTEGLES